MNSTVDGNFFISVFWNFFRQVFFIQKHFHFASSGTFIGIFILHLIV
jgi:hypothetical protein